MGLTYNNSSLSDEVLAMLIDKAEEMNIPPSYLITKLHFEGLWGTSEVAKANNNLSGMTWTGNPQRPSGVVVAQGSARPAHEGGYYMKYASLSDFFTDWLFLMRRGGYYKVADSATFAEAVKGMFQYGGATYDYATMNVEGSQRRYELYLQGMEARREAINRANNGALDRLDSGEKGVSHVVTANQVVNKAASNLGVRMGDSNHHAIVNAYNAKSPRPVGYAAKYSDDWCDVFVTWVFDSVGGSHLSGRECGVQRHKVIMQQKGIWQGRVWPQAGDIVIFDWQGYSAGWADHIGIVEKVQGNMVHTIEGNAGRPSMVRRASYAWNSPYIVGYGRPKYDGASTSTGNQPTSPTPNKSTQEVAKEVLAGKWGNNPERTKKLTEAGYPAQEVQAEVNRLIQAENSKQPQEEIKPAPAEDQPIGGERPKLADNEVLINGVIYVITKKG